MGLVDGLRSKDRGTRTGWILLLVAAALLGIGIPVTAGFQKHAGNGWTIAIFVVALLVLGCAMWSFTRTRR